MRIFLDVGAHDGQTLEEVVNPRHGFDVIHALEPMPTQFANLVAAYSHLPQVVLHPFGLGAASGQHPIYGTNDGMEASIYPAKADLDPTVVTVCELVEATAFLQTLPFGAELVVKLNCEGAEIPILANLCYSGEIGRITNVMIDFDVRKIPGMEGEEAKTLALLKASGFDRYVLCEDVMHGPTHQDRIRAWLTAVGY